MFVVRFTPPDGDPKFEIFEGLTAAKDRFDKAVLVAQEYEIAATIALFEVDAKDDARLAKQMVIDGRARILNAKGPREILGNA